MARKAVVVVIASIFLVCSFLMGHGTASRSYSRELGDVERMLRSHEDTIKDLSSLDRLGLVGLPGSALDALERLYDSDYPFGFSDVYRARIERVKALHDSLLHTLEFDATSVIVKLTHELNRIPMSGLDQYLACIYDSETEKAIDTEWMFSSLIGIPSPLTAEDEVSILSGNYVDATQLEAPLAKGAQSLWLVILAYEDADENSASEVPTMYSREYSKRLVFSVPLARPEDW